MKLKLAKGGKNYVTSMKKKLEKLRELQRTNPTKEVQKQLEQI